jgi:hypothetical protein
MLYSRDGQFPMDDSSTASAAESPAASGNALDHRRQVRVWPMAVVLALFWAFLYVN